MRKLFPSCLSKLVAHPKDLSTSASVEQTGDSQKHVASSPQKTSANCQGKTDHQVTPAKAKSKKRRIPFIALALVMLFFSLCTLPLALQQPQVLAAVNSSSATLHHSGHTSLQDAPTPDNCLVTDCYGGNAAKTEPWGDYQYYLISDCSNGYKTIVTSDGFCWNDNDFQWGIRDITCVLNTHLTTQQQSLNHDKGINFGPSTAPGASSTTGTPSASSNTQPNTGTAAGIVASNQNTCTNNSICYSDNRSGNDGDQIHSKIGGDNIICFNKACIGQGGPIDNENCGGLPYDRFACAPIGINTGYYYNPTAYYPSGAYEQPNGNMSLNGKNGSIQVPGSGDTPTCNDHWMCKGGDNIFLAMTNQSGTFANPFTGNPEEIAGSTTTDYQDASGGGNGGGGNGGPGGSAATNSTTTWNYPPEYEVGCNNVGSNWIFPCSDKPHDGGINEQQLRNDWLSGDIGGAGDNKHPAHISVTYADETHDLPNLIHLSDLTLGLGYALVLPAVILIGYQLLWASWTYRRVATAEMFARLMLSIIAVSASYQLATMLVGLSNLISQSIVTLHGSLGYPDMTLNGMHLTYTLDGEQSDPTSFRGIVVPISRWGCAMNDFMEILAEKLGSDIAGFVPFIGGFVKLALGIADAVKAFRDIGEFMELLLSINFCIQIYVRIALVNYYILTAPLVFGCWGLPGATGQRIVGQWFKGFCSILFVQAVQLFVLTTMPLLLPAIPDLPTDTLGILSSILRQLPRVIILMAVIKMPAILGTGATKAIAQAGNVGSGAVAAVAAAAYNVV